MESGSRVDNFQRMMRKQESEAKTVYLPNRGTYFGDLTYGN
jgi:hypothetical protein